MTLSRPLPEPLAAGNHPAATLAYRPFERPRLADGSPNPDFEETMAGWLDYVDVVTREAREVLGGTEFDVEIWNELSFGSDFLDAANYYAPASEIGVGETEETEREILARTIAFIREPGRGLEEVGIGDGFANQRPWEAGGTSPPGLTAIDKHPYEDILRLPGDHNAFFPEHFLSAIQTEHLVRDLSPITTDLYGTPHGRNTHPPGSPSPEVWITETGWDFEDAGVTGAAAGYLRAKATLRATTAFVNKGVGALHFYDASDEEYALIDRAFFDQLDQRAGGYPAAATVGRTMAAMGRMMARFEPGELDTPRQPP